MQINKLVTQLGHQLKAQGLILATAESCTGGQIAAAMTALAGSSAWFERGFVTYTNLAKHELLAVPEEILARYGAVSKETALAMVTGAIKQSQAKVAIATTGIAGPSGGTPAKPVGTVWIAWATPNLTQAECFHFGGDRASVREQSVEVALQHLLKLLEQ